MKRAAILWSLLLLISTSLNAGEPVHLPDYYSQSDFLGSAPSVSGGASGGLFNPAVWGMIRGSEAQFFWSEKDKNRNDELSNWALLMGSPGMGFSVQHWNFKDALGDNRRLDDYHIGFGGGDRANAFGLGYSWSKGYNGLLNPRDNTLSAGWITRPCRYASAGIAGHYALRNKDLRGVLDVGVRPLGTPLVTLFGDAAMPSNTNYKGIEWAAGLGLEPLPGITLQGKMFHGGAFQVGLALSLGTAGISATSHYGTDKATGKDNQQLYNTYGVRVGYPTPNLLTPRIMRKSAYLKLDFDNQIKYQRYQLFDTGGQTLTDLLETLENAKNDPHVAGLTLKITEDFYASYEVIWEVREKILEVKASGKEVVVWLERGDMPHYYLASAADRIMVDPTTTVTLLGFKMGRTYYANMLAKLGLGFDEWRFFKYKSAVESFSRTSMSDADREQRQALIDGFYETMRADICASRNITAEQFDHVVNDLGILTADSLKFYHLADTTGRWSDAEDWIQKVDDKKEHMIVGNAALEAMRPIADQWGMPPQIAVIYAIGPCSMNDGINGRRLEKTIQSARNNSRIKAVVFRSDSPGGDIMPSDIVAQELKKTMEKKPVIVSQGMVAASGGYWISMNSTKIVASPWTITGSIGVIGGWMYDAGFGDKIGLSYDQVKRGEHADMGSGITLPLIGAQIPERNLTPQERSYMEITIKGWYHDFVSKVAAGRKMTEAAVDSVAQGRVWTGTTGKQIGLVDELGGLEKAIALAKEAAKIAPETKVDLVEMPEKGLFDPAMFAPKLLGIKASWFESKDDLELQYLKMLLTSEGKPLAILPPDMMIQ